MFQQQMQNNPQLQQMQQFQGRVNEMLSGKNPQQQEQVFRNMCQNMGVNADEMLKQAGML